MVKPTNYSSFKSSSFTIDFINYESLTQNALNKKILKWKNQIDKYNCKDKYAIKYYIKKELNTEVNLIWLLYLCYIKINLVVIDKFYQKRKLECAIFNKQKNMEYLKQQVICECGSLYSKRNKQAHLKTKKHIIYRNKEDETLCKDFTLFDK
jgi:cell division protein FtsL